MNKIEFNLLALKSDFEISSAQRKDLEDLVQQFPYFQLAQMLLVGKLKAENSPLFKGNLSNLAAKVANRESLFLMFYPEYQVQIATSSPISKPALEEKVSIPIPEVELKKEVAADAHPPLKKPEENINKKEIIDHFIRTSPAIRRPENKNSEFEDKPLNDTSIDEKYDLVSETLAELYLQQGAKEKSIKVYQKLILIYPEKSAFFAARILEIENNQ